MHAALAVPVQRTLDLTLGPIRYLENQIAQVEQWISTEVQACPAILKLATIPGVGLVLSSGIGAEIGNIKRFIQGTKWDKSANATAP